VRGNPSNGPDDRRPVVNSARPTTSSIQSGFGWIRPASADFGPWTPRIFLMLFHVVSCCLRPFLQTPFVISCYLQVFSLFFGLGHFLNLTVGGCRLVAPPPPAAVHLLDLPQFNSIGLGLAWIPPDSETATGARQRKQSAAVSSPPKPRLVAPWSRPAGRRRTCRAIAPATAEAGRLCVPVSAFPLSALVAPKRSGGGFPQYVKDLPGWHKSIRPAVSAFRSAPAIPPSLARGYNHVNR
jgi:hypothetical protein